MSEDPIINLPTDRMDLPSGGWASFRTSVKYGWKKQLNEFAARTGAKIHLKRNAGAQRGTKEEYDAEFIDIDPESLAAQQIGVEYFPLVYMLTGWSYDLPLPTLQNLDSLDEIELDDGDFLMAEAKRRLEPVDFSPNLDPERSSPTTPS